MRLVPIRQAKMAPNPLDERVGLRRYRKKIEGVNSQREAGSVQRLHARTHAGFMRKVWASLFALRCMNACEQARSTFSCPCAILRSTTGR